MLTTRSPGTWLSHVLWQTPSVGESALGQGAIGLLNNVVFDRLLWLSELFSLAHAIAGASVRGNAASSFLAG